MDDVGLRGDEDFLLVHSVEDSAEYREEITHFDLTGNMIYNCLKDPRLVVAYDADCLAFKGLANTHPGKSVSAGVLNNYLSDAFALGNIWAGGTIRYRRPRRKRAAGALASIQFELEVIPGQLSGGAGTAPDAAVVNGNPVYSINWPNPANVLTTSTDATPPAQESLFGSTIFWRRKTTLDLGALLPAATLGRGDAAEITQYYQSWPVENAQPADYAGFLSIVDTAGDDESDIVEVYHVPSATTWFLAGGETAVIPQYLVEYVDPSGLTVGPGAGNTAPDRYQARYIAKWEVLADSTFYSEVYTGNYANLAAFQAAYPDTDEVELVALFDAKTNTWLLGP